MADIYKVGIAIALTNNVSAVLAVISRDLLGVNAKASQLQGTFNRVKLAALGAAGVIGGVAVLSGLGKLVEHGEKLVHQQYELRKLGMDNADVALATASAWKTAADVMGTGATRNLEILREAKGAFGTLEEAQALLPSLAKADVVQGGNDRGLQTVMKAMEIRGDIRYSTDGKMDIAYGEKGLNAAMKFLAASGGQVDANTLKGLITMAGPMAKMMTPDAFYRTMLTVTEELQQKAGTALSAAGRALYGGIMPQRNTVELERLGLIDPKKVHVRRGGNVSIDQGALTGFDTLNGPGGLPDWVNKVLMPQFHTDFLKAQTRTPNLTEQQYDQQELYRAFPTETMRRLVGIFIQQAASVTKGAANYDAAQGLDAYDTAFGRSKGLISDGRRDRDSYDPAKMGDIKTPVDPTASMKAFKESWDNLLTALGAPMVETAYTMLNHITAGLTSMSQWAAAHQDLVRTIDGVAAGLGTTAIVFGTLALGVAAVAAAGPLAAGIGLLALAAGVLAAAAAIPSLRNALGDLVRGLTLNPFVKQDTPEQQQFYKDHPLTQGPKVSTFGNNPDGSAKTFGQGLKSFLGIGNGTPTAQPQAYHPPSVSFQPRVTDIAYRHRVDEHFHLYVDGKEMHHVLKVHRDRETGRPRRGPTASDNRLHLLRA
jgi:hypothetical protein